MTPDELERKVNVLEDFMAENMMTEIFLLREQLSRDIGALEQKTADRYGALVARIERIEHRLKIS